MNPKTLSDPQLIERACSLLSEVSSRMRAPGRRPEEKLACAGTLVDAVSVLAQPGLVAVIELLGRRGWPVPEPLVKRVLEAFTIPTLAIWACTGLGKGQVDPRPHEALKPALVEQVYLRVLEFVAAIDADASAEEGRG